MLVYKAVLSAHDRLEPLRRIATVITLFIVTLILIQAPDAVAAEPGTTEQNTSDVVDGAECPADGEGRKCGDGSTDPGEVPLGNLPSLLGGNPINLLSGNKHQQDVDFAIPGSKLTLQRVYNSQNADNNIGLGQGWHHTFAVSLYDAGDGQLEIVQSNGSRIYFTIKDNDSEGNRIVRSGLYNEGYLIKRDRYHEWHLPDGRTLRFRGQYLVSIDWPDHQNLKLFYTGGQVASVTDETGRVLRFNYHAGSSQLRGYEATRYGVVAGHLSRVTLPDGSAIEYDYDQNRNLTRARFADGTSREFHYEDEIYPNHLTGLTERTGVRLSTWRYDETGRAVSSEHANGFQQLRVDYPDLQSVDAGGIVKTQVTNALGQQSSYTWQKLPGHSRPQLLAGAGVACSTCPSTGFSYTYDNLGRLLRKSRTGEGTAAGVGGTRFVYDEQGRVSEIWYSDENSREHLSERLEYEGQSLQPARRYTPSINPDTEQVTETLRDEQGLPVQVTRKGFSPQLDDDGRTIGFTPIDRITRYAYEEGRLVSVDGSREDVDDLTRFEWDSQNRMTTIILPDSPPLRITEFDALGRATTFVKGFTSGRSASPVAVDYNAASQIKSVTQSGRTLSLKHDAEGRLTGIINRAGREMALDYDNSGQLNSIDFIGGQRVMQDYDEEGHIVGQSLMDQYGDMIRSVSKLYDAQGRVASVTRDVSAASGSPVHSMIVDYQHDEHNRLVQATSRVSSSSVALQYTADGELAGIIDANGSGIELGYDIAGNPVSLTDTRNNKTQFIQDDFTQVVAVISGDSGLSRYEYDAAGNRKNWTAPDGTLTNYAWDAANRPLLIDSVDGITRFSYDRDTGLLSETSNPFTTERFSYDNDGRILSHKRLIDQRTFITQYRYDEQGRMLSRKLPDGQSLRYHYYETGVLTGQLRAVTRSSLFGLQQEVLLAEIVEDPNDGVTGYIAHNGKRTTRTHAADGRVTRIEVSDTLTLNYRYDELGRIVGIEENGAAQSFGYANGYLSAASTLSGSYIFNYDEAGNRTGKSETRADGQRTRTQYDYADAGDGNRLIAEEDVMSQSRTELSYNASGSPVERGTRRFEYNQNQRPVRVFENDELLAEYTYNSFGERIRKVTYRADQKRVTYFLYDGHQLSAEIVVEGDSITMSQTIYLQDHPVIQLVAQAAYAVHGDRLGTPHLLSDESGAIAWQAEYSPFGKATVLIEDVLFHHRFPGQYEDVETGIHYNYQRDYDPDTGRYLTSDPLSISGGLNTYQYANADPLNSVDVLGLKPDLSPFAGPGTQIDGTQYDQLHGYAMAEDGLAYFTLMFELTGHGLYKDFADSYSHSFTPAAMYILREVFMRHGTNSIEQVGCLVDRTPVYQIDEMDLFSETVFQLAGVERGAATFVVEGGVGLWNLGRGTVNLALDSTLGIYGDAMNFLAGYFDAPVGVPAWFPSYADAVDTIEGGLGVGAMILAHPELIWQGLREPYVSRWAEGRYGEALSQGALELGSMFVGVGVTAGVRVARLADLMGVIKRVDAVFPNEFNNQLDELVEGMLEQGEDLDLLRRAAEEAGLDDIAALSPNQIVRGWGERGYSCSRHWRKGANNDQRS